jgi:Fic family protein
MLNNNYRIPIPNFESNLTDLIIELDHLRKKKLFGTTHPKIFFQLKNIFHILESIGSARIEGNRTTIAEYIESKISNQKTKEEDILEISNIEAAMNFIDENVADHPINRMLVSELHKMVVKDLKNEGSHNPGNYRKVNLKIAKSNHTPPDFTLVNDQMSDLFDFINHPHQSKYDLLKIAIVHHRFAFIHPFDNGNGRTVRLLTYAMLIKQGFNIKAGRILNPTAIFCNNRNHYYEFLSKADSGNDANILEWCEYVLSGLKLEIEKIDRLLNYQYLQKEIMIPVIDLSYKNQHINDLEKQILLTAISKDNQVFSAVDIEKLTPNKLPAERSRILRRLKDKKIIIPAENKNSRKYVIGFSNSYLLRSVIEILDNKGFLPIKE